MTKRIKGTRSKKLTTKDKKLSTNGKGLSTESKRLTTPGVHPNSIEENLFCMDSSLKNKYYRNKRKFEADSKSLESWARQGFTSYPGEEGGEGND